MGETANATVKLTVDKAANRVLFAEAGKDFIDFLFHIHELPVGIVSQLVRSVSGDDTPGSVQNITDSIRNLPDKYMISNQKDALLNPEVRNCVLKLKVASTSESSRKHTVYGCTRHYGNCKAVLDNPHAVCPGCQAKCKNKSVVLFEPSDEAVVQLLDGEGGYVKGLATYMVTDDLAVKPSASDSYFDLLKGFNVKRVKDIEEKVVDVGLDECKKLLAASLRSKTVLTDTFLPKKPRNRASLSSPIMLLSGPTSYGNTS